MTTPACRPPGVLAALALLAALAAPVSASAQGARPPAAPPAAPAPAVAFVNVNVIAMDGERIDPARTVLVRDGHITAIGDVDAVAVPDDAVVIDGRGRYLVPGLTDAHVHLDGDGTRNGTSRPDFGDGPLYIAHGVTSVFNLRGTPAHLDWRRRIEAGTLIGPTIYTAGEFVNEPRVTTADEVRREIELQARIGYDLVKFHEIWTREDGNVTRRGLTLDAYLAMNDAAREQRIPLVGHAPIHLGLDALLTSGQALAHVGALSNIYFLPLAAHRTWLAVTAGSFLALIVLVVANAAVTIGQRRRSGVTAPLFAVAGAHGLTAVLLFVGLLAAIAAASFLPGGPRHHSLALRLCFSALVFVMATIAAALAVAAWSDLRDDRAPAGGRLRSAVGAIAALSLAAAAALFWLPVAWRSSDASIDRLAVRLRDAGVVVQTTLVTYDAIGGPRRAALHGDPAIDALRPDVRARWKRLGAAGPPGYRYADFMIDVTRALHRAGVPLLAGTDAMGFPLVAPGSSLHHELELLVMSGLTPYEALRTATVVPAAFMRAPDRFGTVALGARGDLLLVPGNPLVDIRHLRRPDGVMARGRWYPRERLDEMIAVLEDER
jgi:hypothetical protein